MGCYYWMIKINFIKECLLPTKFKIKMTELKFLQIPMTSVNFRLIYKDFSQN
jgi:hypothetical protein